jgi:Acetyltransferase (GNAT) family
MRSTVASLDQRADRAVDFAFRRLPADDPQERVWLIDEAGDIVGGCRTMPSPTPDLGPRAAEVRELTLQVVRANPALASRLLGQAVNDLLVRSHAPVYTWVDADDEATIAFYDRHGFRADGAQRALQIRLVRQP